MLRLTRNAAIYIDSARTASGLPETVGVRMSQPDTDEIGRIRVSFANAPDPSDEVVECLGARVFVAASISALLDDRLLDTELRDGAERLVIRVPGG